MLGLKVALLVSLASVALAQGKKRLTFTVVFSPLKVMLIESNTQKTAGLLSNSLFCASHTLYGQCMTAHTCALQLSFPVDDTSLRISGEMSGGELT